MKNRIGKFNILMEVIVCLVLTLIANAAIAHADFSQVIPNIKASFKRTTI